MKPRDGANDMRIIFKPNLVPDSPNELVFIAVAHDDGTPIPDDRLKWMADGDHEALCVECLIGMNPAPTPPAVPPGQLKDRLATILDAAIRAQDDDHGGDRLWTREKHQSDGSLIQVDGHIDLDTLAAALLDAGVTPGANSGNVDPDAGRDPASNRYYDPC